MQGLAPGLHRLRPSDFASNDAVVEPYYCEGGDRGVTLFIECSDALLVPDRRSTGTPGVPFVVSNVGNLVPSASIVRAGDAFGAALQYAVEELLVGEIVVCGHTHCPAIFALLHPDRVAKHDWVAPWVAQAARLREIAARHYAGLEGAALASVAVRENVLVQLETLRTFDFVSKALDEGTLNMRGWVFDERTHQTFAYEHAVEQFVRLADD